MKTLPERMREAAETLNEANVRHGSTTWPAWAPDSLRHYANVWEVEDAVNAEVEDLAQRLFELIGGIWRGLPDGCREDYRDRARKLLDAGYRKVEK